MSENSHAWDLSSLGLDYKLTIVSEFGAQREMDFTDKVEERKTSKRSL